MNNEHTKVFAALQLATYMLRYMHLYNTELAIANVYALKHFYLLYIYISQ